jgi:hypothetical protein
MIIATYYFPESPVFYAGPLYFMTAGDKNKAMLELKDTLLDD